MRCFNLLILLFCSVAVYSQADPVSIDQLDKKSRKKYEKALNCLSKAEPEKAKGITKIEEVVQKYPNFTKGLEKLSGYYLDTEQADKAIPHLEALLESSTEPDPRAAVSLSYPYEQKREFDKAISAIELALANPNLTKKQKKKVQKRYEELVFRKEAYANPVDFEPVKFTNAVNTDNGEYHPVFTADGNLMIYVKVKEGRQLQEDLYYSELTRDSFEIGQPISELEGSEGAFTLSQDGRILIFTACDRRNSLGGCDLYISFKKGKGWTAGKNMGESINSRFWDSAPSLSSDGRTLYFASKRKGGQGGSDIWMAKLNKMNKWDHPINLGPLVNTEMNEEAPYLHPDNQSLYFISNGHVGMGSYDVFLSKLENGEWTAAENLGYPINTEKREGGLFVDLTGSKAYYSSNMDQKGSGDIFSFELPQKYKPGIVTYLSVEVRDASTKGLVVSKVELEDLSGKNSARISSDVNGKIITTISPGEYAMSVSKDGYLFHSENIVLDKGRTLTDPFIYVVYLQPIVKDPVVTEEIKVVESKPVVLNNIFFETGSAFLMPRSDGEIFKLAELLQQNADLNIKIIGHTDNVGNDVDNKKLSEERAKTVYERLIAAKISKNRLAYEGMGETVPLADNDTDEGRRKNRRTEFVIIN